jgi:branched-chain amino acid transport system ATP-binding protein
MKLALHAVTVDGLTAPLLDSLSLQVHSSSCAAVLGARGATRRALMAVLSGTERPSAGHIRLDGRDITALACRKRARLGLCYISADDAVFANLTVLDNLLVFADGSRDRADRAIAAFPELASLLAQPAHTLSGGERQMVALSRAVIQQPGCLILDDPSAGLSTQNVERLYQFVRGAVRSGSAVLIADEHSSAALAAADTTWTVPARVQDADVPAMNPQARCATT